MTSLESRCVAFKPLPNDDTMMTAILPINFAYTRGKPREKNAHSILA